MGSVSSPALKTVRSATVKGVMRLSRIKPLAAPPASQTADTAPHQNTRRRRSMAGARVASTMAALVEKAMGERAIYRSSDAGPSVNDLWLKASTVSVTAKASKMRYKNTRISRRVPVSGAFSEDLKGFPFFQVPDYSPSIHGVPVVFWQIFLLKF